MFSSDAANEPGASRKHRSLDLAQPQPMNNVGNRRVSMLTVPDRRLHGSSLRAISNIRGVRTTGELNDEAHRAEIPRMY